MPMFFATNLERIEALLNVSNNLSKTNQRWHFAFLNIYCCRTLVSHIKANLLPNKNKKNPKLSPSSSYTLIDLNPDNSFSVTQTSLVHLVKDKNLNTLQKLGGVHGVAAALETNVENGIKESDEDASDMMRRREAFGSNTHPRPPSRSFLHFVIEAFKDPTILILFACAALSLGFSIKENELKEGWYEGGSIFVAVFLVIAVSSIVILDKIGSLTSYFESATTSKWMS